jgi:hypothetical protein
MIRLPRRDDTSAPQPSTPATATGDQAPRQADRPDGAIDAAAIARKPRQVATVLQRLHGI